jgi:hypothetical protein
VLRENQGALDDLQSNMTGLSKDGMQLSLYKDWHIIHYLLTGRCWEPADSLLGKAVVEGVEIPDLRRVTLRST